METRKFILTRIHKYLHENVNRDKSRKVLFVDEYGKKIVYDDGDFRIAIDDENDARYITLWHKEYVNGKESWVKRGFLDAWKSKINFKDRNGYYLSIHNIEIDRNFRDMGYGYKLYKTLFDFSGDDIKGIYSYLPNRINKKQVPKIYNKFGGIIDGDYHFIDFNN